MLLFAQGATLFLLMGGEAAKHKNRRSFFTAAGGWGRGGRPVATAGAGASRYYFFPERQGN
jgi:hypothetical protein